MAEIAPLHCVTPPLAPPLAGLGAGLAGFPRPAPLAAGLKLSAGLKHTAGFGDEGDARQGGISPQILEYDW